jgi:MerR family transcriptional regulator, copper efflux regulator
MLINELAKQTGISTHTIRYYEKFGLISGKQKEGNKTNNYYHYNEVIVEKLLLIRDAKSIGFSLKEIKALLEAWYSKKISIEKKLLILDEKTIAIDEKITQLKEMKKMIAHFKKDIKQDAC